MNVGVESKGVRSGVERRRGVSGSKTRGGRRDTREKVLKERRSPRERGRMGTSVRYTNAPEAVLVHRRSHRLRVQHLRAKVRELGGLLEGQKFQNRGVINLPRVRGEDSVDVLPHLHLRDVQRGADHRRGEV